MLIVCGIDASGNTTYYAFDLCCPHEAKRNIIIEPNNTGTAICPECGTEFDIAAYGGSGAPVKGVSKYPLRRYTVSSMSAGGQEWVVTN
ncbi:MAG: hypothetical protein LUH63_02190 [Parabacteroides sp.]|nr:hypothetical protein [Parabacteroides sp.]